ncbi:MAG: tRNA (guanine37-N1)-methyltransferase, partial [Candidatus Eremiobacteraeota bacterium]|nr:tRNA (guanine37-N1)-methyltransferase [Candidatus Eremiobacteraeota bacterium]
MRHRFVRGVGFEEHVADRRDRRGTARIGFERADELVDRKFKVAAMDGDDGTFVAHERDLGGRPRKRQSLGERGLCVVEPAAVERACAARERLGRSPAREQATQTVEERHVGVLHVDVVSLFPEMFAPVIGLSIVGRALERGLVEVRMHDLLDALEGRERADERPYGGGPGMVLRIEPLARTLDAILAAAPAGERRRIVLTSASGPVFRQADAAAWAELDRLILICGHYEGVDERLRELYPVEEVSLGEFVLTGGEIAAMAFLDAMVRLVPGAIDAESAASESWTGDELDHPAYTRPPRFRGVDVPPVLLSGD